MHAQTSDEHVAVSRRFRNRVAPRISFQQVAFLYQGTQTVSKFATVVALEAQLAEQLFVGRNFLRLPANVTKDGGVGQHQFSVPGSQFPIFGFSQ